MSIDEDLSLLMSRLPEPERLGTGKAATWPSAIHVLVRVLLALRDDVRAMKERDPQAMTEKQERELGAWLTLERQRVASLLSAAFVTTGSIAANTAGSIEEQIASICRVINELRKDRAELLEELAECRRGEERDRSTSSLLAAERMRIEEMLTKTFGTAGAVVDQIEAIRCIVNDAQMEARGVRELERQVQHEQARWARIQPVIRALHSWEVHGPDSENGLASAFETWQRTEAAALDGEHVKPRGPLTRAEAAEIARRAASGPNRPSYYAEPFEPHLWVVDALIMLDRELRSAVLTEDVASAAPTSGPTLCNGQHEAPGMAAPFVPCDREHTAPACPDAQCWRREKAAEVTTPGKASARPIATTTGERLVEIRSPHDPTTASIEAGNHARADLREQLRHAIEARDYAFEERDRAMAQRDEVIDAVQEARTAANDAFTQRQKLLDDGLAARLLADAMLEAVKPLLPNGCKLDPDSIKVAIGDYVSDHNNLVHAVKVLAKELQ